MYSCVRPILFRLEPERAHAVTLKLLDMVSRTLPSTEFKAPRQLMGLTFPNPVGLAAGLDKNGEHLPGLAALGFGFMEIGTVTPRPQPGNPLPRLFRLPEAKAIINRMGFNNAGVDALVANVKSANYRGILGINIGKNKDTEAAHAAQDYVTCLHKVYPLADYVTLNISSPNTPGLRDLQYGATLRALLQTLKGEQQKLADMHRKYVPLVVKIAPDLSDEELDDIATILLESNIEGVIATNTTSSREGVAQLLHGNEVGGLSGRPLTQMSTRVIARLYQTLRGTVPIIGVGGIMCGEDARAKIDAGAALVQLYSGLIYRGPALIREVCHALNK
jgi:dihydroorotate dehydrogenase